MKWLQKTAILLAGVVSWIPSPCLGDVLTVSPIEAVVLPAGNPGEFLVAMRFDLSGVRRGEGLSIDNAHLEWTLDATPGAPVREFQAVEITEAWDTEQMRSGRAVLKRAVKEEATWKTLPRDYERIGGLFRLDTEVLVGKWVRGGENHGVLIRTKGVSREALESRLGEVKLVVLYGFMPGVPWIGRAEGN